MRRIVSTLIIAAAFIPAPALAQPKVDLSTLPAEIKTLQWKDVNFASLPALDQCRALLLLNDFLDEVNAQVTGEADLLSQYIDINKLGDQFASQPPVADTAPLTLGNAMQIAAALLKGPMASSSYATQLSGSPADVLTAYESMYNSTCQRKWSTVADFRLRVRNMTAFLQSQKKLEAFQAWVPGEIQSQNEQHQAEMAARRAAAAAATEKRDAEYAKLQQERYQQQQQQMQQQQKASIQMQQAMAAAQQNQSGNNNNNNQGYVVNGGYPGWYYGGLAGVGLGAAGATWYHNNVGDAAARCDARYGGWHGGGFRR
jgi:hypothetical protein